MAQSPTDTNQNHLSEIRNFDGEGLPDLLCNTFDLVSSIIVITDKEANIKYINKYGKQYFGMENTEENGPNNWIADFVHPNEQENVSTYISGIVNNKISDQETIQYKVKTQKETDTYLETSAQYISFNDKAGGLVVLSCRDITNYWQAESKLKDSIQLYRILAGNIPDINMYLFDTDTKHIIAEGREMKRYGLSKEYVEGKTLTESMPAELVEIFKPLYLAALDGKEISTEYDFQDNTYLIWVMPVRNHKNQIYAGMAITQNVSEYKQFESNLSQAKDEAEMANNAKSEFLATITHEIRTPLNAIIGFTEQLQKSELNDKQQNFTKIIEKSSEHLLSLVNEILVLSRIEAGEVRFDEVPFKVSSVVEEVHDTLKIKADQKNIHFHYQVHQNIDRVVVGDPFRLKQILINIINNAIKFTDAGYVGLNCFLAKADDNNVQIRFDITDTGVGISKEKLASVFEQFKQADSSVTRNYGGTGLGLTISKKLTDLQNGSISVRSELGMGTQFTVILPYQLAGENVKITESSGKIKPELLTDLSFLLVDDDSVNRLLGKTILQEFDCHIDVAIDGVEAIDKLKSNTYDVILLDIHMPKVSGLEVADFIRKEQGDSQTCIIAVTAAVLKADIENYREHGINDYLIKPFREINLYHKIVDNLDLEDIKIELTEAETILDNENTGQPYNLTELKKMSGNDNVFFKNMLQTFKKNANDGVSKLTNHYNNSQWDELGEAAHKMLPSFRHLQVTPVIDKLYTIKIKTLEEKNYTGIDTLLPEVIDEIKHIIELLDAEIKSLP